MLKKLAQCKKTRNNANTLYYALQYITTCIKNIPDHPIVSTHADFLQNEGYTRVGDPFSF